MPALASGEGACCCLPRPVPSPPPSSSRGTPSQISPCRDSPQQRVHLRPQCLVTSVKGKKLGCGFFAYNWKLPAYSGALLLTIDNFSFFTYSWCFFAHGFSFFTYNWSFFAYSGQMHLIRASRDCKQRSLTVSKKAPTVIKKASPERNTPTQYGCIFFGIEMSFLWYRGGLSLLFGIESFFGVSRFCTLLFGIEIVFFLGSTRACFLGPRHPVHWRSTRSRYRKEDQKISIPQKRHLDTN